ncbi:acetamidase/formamidase family protein [Paenibacillus humicola]|uniref:acetamidase/formamidase family protein n=1 Tax=Paenibacillus humicola TaxID=3110540 RepID=UPI00237B09AB|nr:acetamidase/formamidase family protein [Paenibacillus humicola]
MSRSTHADHILQSTPDTVVRGYLSPFVKPALRIYPGETVQIDTVTGAGVPQEDPEGFFNEQGIPFSDSVQAIVDIVKNVEGRGHILTGPVYIEGAEPGDMLEIRILDLKLRDLYAVNRARPGAGALPDLAQETYTKVISYDMERNTALFNENIDIPLAPFMGVMGLAATEKVPSGPPGRFGGNLDLKELTKGATLFLPVMVEGGLFYTGDAHGAQGNGEANINGLETSLIGVFEFILHKGTSLQWPTAETPTHFIVMGLDEDLNIAARIAVEEAIRFLSGRMGLSPMDAYALSSLAVDFEVTQLVNGVKGVHGMIAKKLFKNLEDTYWAKTT